MALAAAKAIETALWSRSVSEQLDVSYRYFDAAVESLSDGLIVLDQNLKVLRINRLAAKVTGLHVGDNLALSVKDGLFLEKVIRSLENCGGFQGQEVAFLHQGGVQRLIVDGEPILDGQGKRLGMILTLFEMRRARKLAHRIYGARAVYRFEDLIGEDPEFKKCVETLRKASRADCPIILYGESGTGKEMCAQAVHNFSTRRDGPFIPINCAAIPRDLLESELFGYEEGAFTGARKGGNPGKFELADGGTLFLDEIDSMPLELQAKLLRIVEEKRVLRLGGKNFLPVDVRIIAASCKDLLYKILEGKFREDLYYRLSVVEVHLPPLRERREDIPLLARHFLQRYAKSPEDVESHLQPRILQALQAYDWPGNIRELSNWVERMLTIGAGETMEAKIARYPLRDRVEHESENAEVVESSRRLEEIEASHIEQVLERNRYNITKTAAELGISRPTLYRKMGKYRIQFERPFARQEAIIRPGPNR
jgi:transcriptional regulator with PAS, ATPase and Fis domain